MTQILLVDDDAVLASMLQSYLSHEGFEATVVHSGEQGVREALSGRYALVVLDVMMPGMGGIEALGLIRRESRVPVLMLTARGDDVDRIVGLELGADDYVPKPCTPRELVARIRAILRRTQAGGDEDEEANAITVDGLTLWPQRRTAALRGEPLALTSTEFNLLELLARHAGRPVTKGDLSEQALGRPLARFDRSIDVHMSSIRHKLGEREGGAAWILTVRGLGYQLAKE